VDSSDRITIEQAARRLGVSVPFIREWLERDPQAGQRVGGRWLVTADRVEHLVRLRQALRALDEEGNPTDDEIREMSSRRHRGSTGPRATPADA
jgi:excisionase family DNA binding protein